jgi:hypothetical protein
MGTEAELTKRLNELAIQFHPTPIRIAALYIDLIEATHAFFFHETIGLREYSFNEVSFEEKVREVSPAQITPGKEIKKILPALRSKGLLNHLFTEKNQHGVPAHVTPAIDNILLSGEPETVETPQQKEERRQRIMQRVLPDHEDWNKKREEFYKAHSITKHALRTTVLNFWNNIAQCCGRVLADWGAISNVFFPEQTIQHLTEIQPTDSDPHKGGKQVLILTFDFTKKLVYKPSDIEVDCLLIGQSDPSNNELRDFFTKTKSLMEIVNESIERQGKLKPLPTYKLLPRNPGSQIEDHQIRNSYGYIEFLTHEESDYQIERIQSKKLVGQKQQTRQKQQATKIAWCEAAGQLMALAVTFSLTDMHTGNVIAHRYTPYLIDLETSFTKRVESIQDTEINRPFMESKCSASSPHCLRMNRQVLVVDLFGREVSSSFVEMLQLLRSLKESKPFSSWCQRLGKVITRVVPFATDSLQKIIDNVYKEPTRPRERLLDQQLRDAIEEVFPFQELQSKFEQRIFTEPKHLLTTHKQFSEDFKNLDIPVFYHRIGTLYLMNSKGQRVEVVGLQDKREYFDKDPFEAIKEQQIYNLGPERITKLTENLLQFWGDDEFGHGAKSALLGSIKKNVVP